MTKMQITKCAFGKDKLYHALARLASKKALCGVIVKGKVTEEDIPLRAYEEGCKSCQKLIRAKNKAKKEKAEEKANGKAKKSPGRPKKDKKAKGKGKTVEGKKRGRKASSKASGPTLKTIVKKAEKEIKGMNKELNKLAREATKERKKLAKISLKQKRIVDKIELEMEKKIEELDGLKEIILKAKEMAGNPPAKEETKDETVIEKGMRIKFYCDKKQVRGKVIKVKKHSVDAEAENGDVYIVFNSDLKVI